MTTEHRTLYVEDFGSAITNARALQIKVRCPFCDDIRSNKTDRSLSINTRTLAYHCHYCDAKGVLKSRFDDILDKTQRNMMKHKKEYKRPEPPKQENFDLDAGLIEYFKSRGISENTLRKCKVSKETHFFPQLNAKKGCIGFNYYLDGEIINVKYRTRNKDFTLVGGAELIPYNIDSISPASYKDGEKKYCLCVEGEVDCLTYVECGYTHVISVPNGANKNLEYLDDFIESHFDHLEEIYISSDNDKKGLELRSELLRRFGQDRCKVVDYPSPCKDINEVLVKYGRDAVKGCVENAIEMKPEGVQELWDVESSVDDIYEHGFQKGTTIGVEDFDKIFSVKTGLLGVITGLPSHGKTFFLNYLLIRLNIMHDWKTAFFSPEFYPVGDHVAQILETFGGKRFNNINYNQQVYEKMKEYLSKNMFWIDPNDTDINSVLERAKYLIKKKGIKVLVIDPFNALTDSQRKITRQDEYISDFLQNLRWFARKYDVAVMLVMHPTKQKRLENGLYPVCDLYDCKGASEIFDKADFGLTVWRNEAENYCEVHVTKMKFRHLGEKGHATFKFDTQNGRYDSIPDAEVLRAMNGGAVSVEPEWDRSNYIIDKVQHGIVQQSISYADYENSVKNNENFDTKTEQSMESYQHFHPYLDDCQLDEDELPY